MHTATDPAAPAAALLPLLEGAVDYAGMFPPAALPLEEAAANYARYRDDRDAWMLGRFICPAARLEDLSALVARRYGPAPWPVSLLASGAAAAANLPPVLAEDLRLVRRLGNDSLRVDSVELRWPADVTDRREASALLERLELPGEGPGEFFFEIPAAWFPGPGDTVLEALAGAGAAGRPTLGAKVRCGGADASAFPSPEALSAFLAACCERGVPFKATAGLHHPFRHYDAEMGVRAHGFVNVFAAAVLLRSGAIGRHEAAALLADEDAGSFTFGPDGFAWRGVAATAERIERAREEALTSFGSCSFDEPREDLRALRLLA